MELQLLTPLTRHLHSSMHTAGMEAPQKPYYSSMKAGQAILGSSKALPDDFTYSTVRETLLLHKNHLCERYHASAHAIQLVEYCER